MSFVTPLLFIMKYDLQQVQTAFRGLVGWENKGYNINVPALTTPFDVAPTSGRYYDNYHPLLTLENLYHTCLTDTPTDTQFNEWLLQFTDQVIERTIDELFNRKKLAEQSKYLLERGPVFRVGANIADTELPTGRFVGWIINLAGYENIRLDLHRIGAHFTDSQNLTLYIFHSSQKAAVDTVTLELIGNSFKWTSSDKSITFSGDHGAGGFYMIGYFEDDLVSAQAINQPLFTNNGDCAFCSRTWNYKRMNEVKKFFHISPFIVESANLDGTNLPNLGDKYQNITTASKSLGLNLDASVTSDVTQTLLDESEVFVNPLRIMAAYMALYHYTKTPRVNNVANTLKKQATVELYQQDAGRNLMNDLENQFKGLDFDFSALKNPSFPEKRGRVRRGAV